MNKHTIKELEIIIIILSAMGIAFCFSLFILVILNAITTLGENVLIIVIVIIALLSAIVFSITVQKEKRNENSDS